MEAGGECTEFSFNIKPEWDRERHEKMGASETRIEPHEGPKTHRKLKGYTSFDASGHVKAWNARSLSPTNLYVTNYLDTIPQKENKKSISKFSRIWYEAQGNVKGYFFNY